VGGLSVREILIKGKAHNPPSGVIMATCKQCTYIRLLSYLLTHQDRTYNHS